ncbi:hypothetical protein HY407_00020, partial [Candidatus Gottesmanbacteria bacterium]|nr:hypothetical protein [Candidatus Gottesmanbacteria bacterium]
MKKLTKLPLYIGMGVLMLSLLFTAYQVTNSAPALQTQTQATTDKVQVQLIPAKGTFPIGEEVELAFTLVSDQEVGGSDLVVRFDPTFVNIFPDKISAGNQFGLASVNITNIAKGEMIVSYVAKNKTGEKNAILGSIKMVGLKKGQTVIN